MNLQEIHVRGHQVTVTKITHLVDRITSALGMMMIKDDRCVFIPLITVCPFLEASQPKLSFNPATMSKKAYFEVVHFSAIKIVISFKT